MAEPRPLRHTPLHAAGRIVRRSRQTWLKLPDNWPWTAQLLAAYKRLADVAPHPGPTASTPTSTAIDKSGQLTSGPIEGSGVEGRSSVPRDTDVRVRVRREPGILGS